MGLIEDITRRLEYGNPCMKELSEMSVKEIVSAIDMIWENSCSDIYEAVPHKDDIEAWYEYRTITVKYKSNLYIDEISIAWGCWDYITIELSPLGLVAEYKPEHGPSKKLLDLTWVLVEPFFFNNRFNGCL